MSRPKRQRQISSYPKSTYFKPAGIRLKELQTIIISFEEFEAIRLKDFLGEDQKVAALQMGISQSTFHRIVVEARKKIAEALFKGMAIKINGGNFIMKETKTDNIKIAISASSGNLEENIDSRFGRCQTFLVFSLNDGNVSQLESIVNLKKDMQGGAGISVAEMLANQKIDVIITGNVGPRALDILNQFSIDVYQFNGSVNDAIKNFIDKKLVQING